MGLIDLARRGRNGDTMVAHLTPGEMVVPREVAAMRPELVAHIRGSIAGYGVDPARYVVGSRAARRNPVTGAQEFASDAEITAAYQQQLNREPDAAGLAYWRDPNNGFSLEVGSSFMTGAAAEKERTAAERATASFTAPPSPSAQAGNDYASPAPAPVFSAIATATPPPAPSPAAGGSSTTSSATTAKAPAPAPSVSNWYLNAFGRDADSAGLAYWNNRLGNGEDAGTLYGEFLAGGTANNELGNHGLGLADANATYTGYRSQDSSSNVDDWARNLYNRAATADEIQRYGSATSVADAQAKFAAFTQANGGNRKGLDLFAASQLTPPAAQSPQNLTYAPNLDQTVSPDATIEGRLNNVLRQDASGNYTNAVVRQAVERAQQQFAARGLLNSSMAAQAGQEAAIAKAIDIVGPDAQRFFEQARANQNAQNEFAAGGINQIYTQQNAAQQQQYTQANNQAQWAHEDAGVDRQQSFNLQQNYIVAADKVNQRYNDRVNNINVSNMTPEDKSVAIAQAAEARDGELVYTNTQFAAQPTWQNQWATVAVATGTLDITAVRNVNTLYNIINDPAQPQSIKERAIRQVQAIAEQERRDAAAAPPPPAPAPAPAESG